MPDRVEGEKVRQTVVNRWEHEARENGNFNRALVIDLFNEVRRLRSLLLLEWEHGGNDPGEVMTAGDSYAG